MGCKLMLMSILGPVFSLEKIWHHGDIVQLARTSALQAEGHRFKSGYLHQQDEYELTFLELLSG